MGYERNSLQPGISKQKPQNQQQPHYVTRKSYARQHPVIFVQHNAVYSREEGCKLSAQLSASQTTSWKSYCFIKQFLDKITARLLCLTMIHSFNHFAVIWILNTEKNNIPSYFFMPLPLWKIYHVLIYDYYPLKGAVAQGYWSSLSWRSMEDDWCPHLLRPLIPEEPLIRHCRRSRSTGSEVSDKRRWAFVAISRSCLAVPAIAVHHREKVLLIKALYQYQNYWNFKQVTVF